MTATMKTEDAVTTARSTKDRSGPVCLFGCIMSYASFVPRISCLRLLARTLILTLILPHGVVARIGRSLRDGSPSSTQRCVHGRASMHKPTCTHHVVLCLPTSSKRP